MTATFGGGCETDVEDTRLCLQLPPELDDFSLDESTATSTSALSKLLRRAKDKLISELGPVEKLKLKNVVGRGGSSCVRLVKRLGTRDMYVAKVFNMLHPEQSDLLSAELLALMAIDCPCVVGFHGAYERDNYVYVVLEAMWFGSLLDVMGIGEQPLFVQTEAFCSGDPWSLTEATTLQHDNNNSSDGNDSDKHSDDEKHNDDNERVMLAISFQLLWGLSYMHSIGLVHGDVKSSNVLVSTCGSVKLADFGTSTFDPGAGNSVAGTYRYMPPERMAHGKFGVEGDVWAAGMVVAELSSQRVPFSSCKTQVEIMQQLLAFDGNAAVEHVLPESARAPESIVELLKQCLTMDPAKRPTAKKLLLSPAFAAQGLSNPEDARTVLEEWMGGENDNLQNSLVLEEDDDDDDEDHNDEETEDDDNDDALECDDYEDFDDDEFDDSGMFNDVANYRPDSVDASALVRRRQGGRTSSAANLLRCASLLAMPTYKKSSVRSPNRREERKHLWPCKAFAEETETQGVVVLEDATLNDILLDDVVLNDDDVVLNDDDVGPNDDDDVFDNGGRCFRVPSFRGNATTCRNDRKHRSKRAASASVRRSI